MSVTLAGTVAATVTVTAAVTLAVTLAVTAAAPIAVIILTTAPIAMMSTAACLTASATAPAMWSVKRWPGKGCERGRGTAK